MDVFISAFTGCIFGLVTYLLSMKKKDSHPFDAEGILFHWLFYIAQRVKTFSVIQQLYGWEPFILITVKLYSLLPQYLHSFSLDSVFALYVLFSCLCSILLGILFNSILWFLFGLAAFVVTPYFLNVKEKNRVALETAHAMPAIFRTIAVALGSGLTLSQSIEYVSKHTSGVVSKNFSVASMQIQCGFPIEQVIDELSHRLDAPGINLLASALVISHRTGSPLKNLLQKTAELVELQEKNRRLIMTKTAQVRLSARIVCVLPIALLVLLALISPDFQRGLFTSTGFVCVAIALLMDCLALFIIRRIMRSVLK